MEDDKGTYCEELQSIDFVLADIKVAVKAILRYIRSDDDEEEEDDRDA